MNRNPKHHPTNTVTIAVVMLVLLGVSYLVYADHQLRQAEQYLKQYDNTVPIENDFYRANAWIEWGRDMGWTDYQHDLTPLYS